MEGMQSLQLAMLRPGCGKYTGGFSCVSSDDERAICLRSFDYRLGMSTARDAMKIFLDRPGAAKGMRFGLAAGPRDGILARLEALRRTAQKPLVAVVDGGALFEPLRRALRERDIPTFPVCDRAVAALSLYMDGRLAAEGLRCSCPWTSRQH